MIISPEAAPQPAQSTRRRAEWWAGSVYIWLGLPSMLVARLAIPVAGLSGLGLVGLVHLTILAAAMRRLSRSRLRRGSEVDLAATLLVLGPAILFLGAATGSPSPLYTTSYGWNTVGLTVGSLVTSAGLVALCPPLWSRGEQATAVLAVAGTVLAAGLWLPSLALRVAVLATASGPAWGDLEPVYAHIRHSNAAIDSLADSWRGFLLIFTYAMSMLAKVLSFLITAGVAIALRRRGLISPASGWLLGGLGLGLAVVVSLGRIFFAVPAVQLAWAASTIPFVAYILPYFLGAALARRNGTDDVARATMSPSDLSRGSRS